MCRDGSVLSGAGARSRIYSRFRDCRASAEPPCRTWYEKVNSRCCGWRGQSRVPCDIHTFLRDVFRDENDSPFRRTDRIRSLFYLQRQKIRPWCSSFCIQLNLRMRPLCGPVRIGKIHLKNSTNIFTSPRKNKDFLRFVKFYGIFCETMLFHVRYAKIFL